MDMDYKKLILQRRSTRDFEDRRVDVERLRQIEDYFTTCMRLLPDLKVSLFVATPDVQRLAGVAGYGGLLIRAPHYLVLSSESAAAEAENAGYIGSDLSLYLTACGLDHCWLTIRDFASAKQAFGLDSALKVAAVLAFGYGRPQAKHFRLDIENESRVDVIRQQAHAAPKVPLDEFVYDRAWGQERYISDVTDEIDLKAAFIAASIAPSYLNRQPYRMIWDGSTVVLASQHDSQTEPYDAKLGLGIVMQHFSAVLSRYRPTIPQWVIGPPEKSYALPPDCQAAAWCQV